MPRDAAVEVLLQFGGSSFIDMVVLASKAGGSWVAFDTYRGNPQNRMTSATPGPCNSS